MIGIIYFYDEKSRQRSNEFLISLLSWCDHVNVTLESETVPRRFVLRWVGYEHHWHFRYGMIETKFVRPKRKVVSFR